MAVRKIDGENWKKPILFVESGQDVRPLQTKQALIVGTLWIL
jgi:hypothetical protein